MDVNELALYVWILLVFLLLLFLTMAYKYISEIFGKQRDIMRQSSAGGRRYTCSRLS